ncbi:hypothetical protein GCM10023149_47660 [Mucilaginibacter gynuensis]|uniref:Uncharacterized protein n=1 Tax=Mucilaginibacter gynuensis TaxID=1302236 RepID=A0ABP8HDQ7_9SPHI
MGVLVFTTTVTEAEQVSEVRALLTDVSGIEDWNFDLEDCDRILRIVAADDVCPRYIEQLLQTNGFCCHELDC